MRLFKLISSQGEMAAWIPVAGGFSPFATRFCDPALGFALGWTYWFKYIIVTPNQLTAAALVISYWVDADKVNPGVWITIFLIAIVAINYLGIRFFGEFEFWLSSIKVLVVCGMIILSLVLALGGGPDGDRKGFRYWKNPGAFKEYKGEGATGRFLGLWSSMVTAVFAYLGTELVGVTVGEAENPRKTIPRVSKGLPCYCDQVPNHIRNTGHQIDLLPYCLLLHLVRPSGRYDRSLQQPSACLCYQAIQLCRCLAFRCRHPACWYQGIARIPERLYLAFRLQCLQL